MTEEQKVEARKQREALKAAAANAKTTVYIQYKGMEGGVPRSFRTMAATNPIQHIFKTEIMNSET